MHANKSTNVRFVTTADAFRAAGRALGALSPDLAGRWAAWLFFLTRRRGAPAAERAVLAAGRRSTVPFEGGTLAVWQWGHGPTVLLAHGWNGRGGQLHALVAPLVALGHRVVTWDGPGHGASTGRSSSLPALARAVAAIADDVGPVRAIVAHSLGGPAAALAVAAGLEVERLVIVAPPTDGERWLEQLSDALALSPEARREARRHLERRAGVAIDRLKAKDVAPALTMPLLVVHDRDDREVSWHDGAALAAMTGARLLATRGLGHQRILRAPEVVRAIADFVGPAAARPDLLEHDLFDREARWARVTARAAS